MDFGVFQGVASRYQQLIIAPNALGLLVHDHALGKKISKGNENSIQE